MNDSPVTNAEEYEDTIVEILMVLTEVAIGDFSNRVRPRDDEATSLAALCEGINNTIDALADAHERNEEANRRLADRLKTIEQQSRTIRELSTPTIEIADGVLVLPLIGTLDEERCRLATEGTLTAVAARQAEHLLIDLTGIATLDSATMGHVLNLVDATMMLGARCILTGIRPNVAQGLVRIGVDLARVTTCTTLKEGLKECQGDD